MPGLDDDSYMAGPTATQAAEAIDTAIDEGKRGTEILSTLLGGGMRVYTSEEMGEDAPMEEEPMVEEMPAEEPMEEPMENDGMPFEGGQEATPSNEGGMRDMRIAAVRFALDKDKENKNKAEA